MIRDVAEYSNGKINIEGSYLELVPDDISHAYNGHLKAKQVGNIDLSPEDFERIPEYVDNYDELVYAIKYKNGSTKICLSKEIENGRVIIIEVVSKSRGSLQFKNMIGVSPEKYIEDYENVYKKRNSTNTGGDQGHSISPRDATASIGSISEKNENVNTDLSEFQDDTIRELAENRAHFDTDYSEEGGRVDEAKTELGEIVRFEKTENDEGDSISTPVIKVGEREVSASDIDLKADSIYSFVDGMDVSLANAMIGDYKAHSKGIGAQSFAAEWKLAYQMGRAHRDTGYSFSIPSEASESARALGEAARQDETAKQKEGIKEAQGKKSGREGTISTEKVQNKKLITDGVMTASKVLSLAGYNIELFEDYSENADRGSYDWDTNTINLNVAVGTGRGGIDLLLGRTLSHEITHSIQRWNPEGYEELKSFIIEKMGDSFEGMVTRRMKSLGLDRESATDEVVAYGCEMMLKNSESLTEFAREHRTIFEKICDAVFEFIDKIRNAISSLYGNEAAKNPEAQFMELYAEELQRIFDKALSAALNASEGTVDHNLPKNEKTAENGGRVQYSKTYTKDGTPVVWIDNNILKGTKGKEHKVVTDYLADHIGDVYTIIESGQKVYLGKDLPSEYMQSKYTQSILRKPQILRAKKRAASNLGEMIEISTNRKWEETNHSDNKDAKYGVYKYTTRFAFPVLDSTGNITKVKAFDATLVILNSSDGKKYLYDLVTIKENTDISGELSDRESSPAKRQVQRSGASIDSIPDSSEKSNSKEQKSAAEVPAYASMPEFYTPIEGEYGYRGEGYTAENGGRVQYERGENETQNQIKLGMSDSERSKILIEKSITKLPTVKDLPDNIIQVIPDITSWEDINTLFGNKKSSLILRLAQEFGATKCNYFNKDIQISFDFSNNNFRESYHKQKVHYEQFGKMFSVFDEIIENAVGIEVHRRDNYKPDPTLERVYVMISAFEDGDQLVPVKLEIKEFKDKTNSLYVAITLQGIKKTEVSKQGTTENGVAQNSRSVTISIPDLMQVVNPSDITFTKYFPKTLLTKEQQAELAKADNLNDNNKIQYSRAEIDTENTTPEEEADIEEYRKASAISLTEALKLTCETEEERAKLAEYEENEKKLEKWRAERAQYELDRDQLFEKEPYSLETEEIRKAHKDAVKLRRAIRSLERAKKAVQEKLTGQEYIILDDQEENAVKRNAKAESLKQRF